MPASWKRARGELRPRRGVLRVAPSTRFSSASTRFCERVARRSALPLPLEGVEQAAAGVAADAEEDQAAAHEHGEGRVDHLDGAAPAAAAEVEQHALRIGSRRGQRRSSSSLVVLAESQRDCRAGSKTRASRMLSSNRTTSGAIAISIVTGSGVGVDDRRDDRDRRGSRSRGSCAAGACVTTPRRVTASTPDRDLEQQPDADQQEDREAVVVLGLQEDVERVVVEVLQEVDGARQRDEVAEQPRPAMNSTGTMSISGSAVRRSLGLNAGSTNA